MREQGLDPPLARREFVVGGEVTDLGVVEDRFKAGGFVPDREFPRDEGVARVARLDFPAVIVLADPRLGILVEGGRGGPQSR